MNASRTIDVVQGKEFLALYDSIRTLLTHRDSDSMFHAVVKHAYLLMGTDVVYVTLFEPAGQVMHAAHGIIDDEYASNRLGHRQGIGGKVESTQAPVWTTNYQDDVRFQHSPETDVILRREGIVALLGVPLKAGSEFRGVLFAGHRTARSFTPDEVAMFSAFADLAAEALAQAGERKAMEDRLDEMRRDYAQVTRRIEESQEADRVHAAIIDSLLAGGQAAEILATLSAHVAGDVFADGYTAGVLGQWPADREIPRVDAVLVEEALAQSRQLGTAQQHALDSGGCALPAGENEMAAGYLTIMAIPLDEKEFGLLQVTSPHGLEEAQIRTVEYAARALGLFLLQRNAVSDAWIRMRSNLLTEILSSSGRVRADAMAHAAAQRIRLEDMSVLVAARWDGDANLMRLLPGEYRGRPLLMGEYMGQMFALGSAADPQEFGRFVHSMLDERAPGAVQVVVSPFHIGLSASHLAARLVRALAVSGRVRVDSPVVDIAELAPYSLVLDPEREQDLEAFLESSLGALLRHDRAHGTELVTTMAAYFEQGQQQKRTAQLLFVHINTLTRRLAKIDELLGEDWRIGPRAAAMHLASQFILWGALDPAGRLRVMR